MMRHLFYFLIRVRSLVILMAMGISACSWLSFKTNLSDLPEIENPIEIEEKWKNTILSGNSDLHLQMGPALAAGRLYAADDAGKLIALDANTGNLLWKRKTKLPFSSAPAIQGGRLYIGTREGEVAAFDLNAKHLFRTKVGSEILSAPLALKAGVLVKASDGEVALLNEAGKRHWHRQTGEILLSLRAQGSPVLWQNTAWVPGVSGKLDNYRLQDGALLHSLSLFDARGRTDIERMVEITSTPLVYENRLYLSAFHGGAAIIDLKTAAVRFQKEGSLFGIVPLSVAEVVLVHESGTLEAWDILKNKRIWEQSALSLRTLTAPVVFQSFVVVGDASGFLYFLDAKTGAIRAWTRFSRHAILARPLVYEDSLIVSDETGTLAAFEIKSIKK